MKNIIPLFLLLFCAAFTEANTFYNMYLLKNLNQHSHPDGYSIGCWGYIQNSREYAIIACNGGTAFIDITDSANIHEVDFLTGLFTSWRDFKIYQHWIYIVNEEGGGIQIADLQYLPDSVHFVRTYSFSGFSRAHTIQQSGPYLYINGGNYMNGGVFVLDLSSNPESPVRRGRWQSKYVHDERVHNDTLWACNIYDGTISIINAKNKDSLKFIRSWTNGSFPSPHNCAITNDRKYLFTTDEILTPVPGKLKIWNIENIFNQEFIMRWTPPGGDSSNVHNIEIYDNLAVISHYTAGVRVLDISNPVLPTEIAWYDTYPQNNGTTWDGCKGIYMFPSGKIIANDKQTGFYCMKIGAPALQLTSLIQGFYDNLSNKMAGDTVRVYLRNVNSPYSIIDSAKSYSDSNGNGTFKFLSALNGVSYYIVIKNRNSIETWSSGGNSFSSNNMVYNFTTAASQAYGNNLILKGQKYCVYSGDVNQDGTIDVTDGGMIDNDAFIFASGYIATDLNGDGVTDLSDAGIADNNVFHFVSKITP